MAGYAAGAVERHIGEQTDVTGVRRWTSLVRHGLNKHDLSTGEPTPAGVYLVES